VDIERVTYSTRRTVYGFVDRASVSDVLLNFDFANPDLPSGRRYETTVPQQALFLMNSPLVVEQARKLTALSDFGSCRDDEARIAFLYDRIYQRPPRPEEIKLGLEFVSEKPEANNVASDETMQQPVSNEGKKFARKQQGGGKQPPFRKGGPGERRRAPLKAWEEYAHALLQANEASFVN
jgi:hypothetical protein